MWITFSLTRIKILNSNHFLPESAHPWSCTTIKTPWTWKMITCISPKMNEHWKIFSDLPFTSKIDVMMTNSPKILFPSVSRSWKMCLDQLNDANKILTDLTREHQFGDSVVSPLTKKNNFHIGNVARYIVRQSVLRNSRWTNEYLGHGMALVHRHSWKVKPRSKIIDYINPLDCEVWFQKYLDSLIFIRKFQFSCSPKLEFPAQRLLNGFSCFVTLRTSKWIT